MDITRYYNTKILIKRVVGIDGAGKEDYEEYVISGRLKFGLSLTEQQVSLLKNATGKIYTNDEIKPTDLVKINGEYRKIISLDISIDIKGKQIFNVAYF